MISLEDVKNAITDQFPEGVEESTEISSVPTFVVRADDLVKMCSFLKESRLGESTFCSMARCGSLFARATTSG